MYFRISSARGADLGLIYGDSRGLYIGDPVGTFVGQGALLNFDSEFVGRANIASTNVVPLIRVRDSQGTLLGVEKSLGDIYWECSFRAYKNQASGPDFQAAISFADADSLQQLNDSDELEINCLIVDNNILIHPHIDFLVYDGEYFKILSVPKGPTVYSRGNAIPVRIRKS